MDRLVDLPRCMLLVSVWIFFIDSHGRRICAEAPRLALERLHACEMTIFTNLNGRETQGDCKPELTPSFELGHRHVLRANGVG